MESLMNKNIDLSKRLTDAHRETFTDWGCIALESVIKGRITHPEADQALMMLRDCVLDRGGDLMSNGRMKAYVSRLGEPKDSIDLTYYRDEHGR
jgi:hypothetical protein